MALMSSGVLCRSIATLIGFDPEMQVIEISDSIYRPFISNILKQISNYCTPPQDVDELLSYIEGKGSANEKKRAKKERQKAQKAEEVRRREEAERAARMREQRERREREERERREREEAEKAFKKAQKKAAQKAKKAAAQGLPPPPMPREEDFLPKRLLPAAAVEQPAQPAATPAPAVPTPAQVSG